MNTKKGEIMKKLFILCLLFTATAAQATEFEVRIQNFKFQPAEVNVVVGDTIRFINFDRATHNVVPATNSVVQFTKSPRLEQGDEFVLQITEAATAKVKCGIHPMMPGVSLVFTSPEHITINKNIKLLDSLKQGTKQDSTALGIINVVQDLLSVLKNEI